MVFFHDQQKRFSVAVPPKCGSTSIKEWIARCSDQEIPNDQAHDWIRYCGLEKPEPVGITIAIHREPADRIISYWRGRMKRDLPTPPLKEWLLRLPELQSRDDQTRMHTRHQSCYLGHDPSAFDIVLPLPELAQLPGLIDQSLPEIKAWNTSPACLVTFEERQIARAFAAHDYLVGWNGETFKTPT